MGLLEFNKLPINTLVGADWKTFNQITAGRTIDPAYKGKYRLTKAVCRLLSTLAPLQDKRYEKLLADKPLEHDPCIYPRALAQWNHVPCTTYSLATSTSAIILPIKQYSHT